MSKEETAATTWIDKQSHSPYPVWALSALCKKVNTMKESYE